MPGKKSNKPPAKKPYKAKVEKQLDKSLKKEEIDKKTYDKLKKALDGSKSAGEFAKDMFLSGSKKGGGGLLKTLGTKKGLRWKSAGGVLDIMLTLVTAGPCPWTALATAAVAKKHKQALMQLGLGHPIERKLNRLRLKFAQLNGRCQQQAGVLLAPKDINKAQVSDLERVVTVSNGLAEAIVDDIQGGYIVETPWELMRVPGVTEQIVEDLLEAGFYFGPSGAAMYELDELAPDMDMATKVLYEFGATGSELIRTALTLRRHSELSFDGTESNGTSHLGRELASRLIDDDGNTVGYRTKNGAALSLDELAAEVEAGLRNLVIVRPRNGEPYVRRSPNDSEADNLTFLPVERLVGASLLDLSGKKNGSAGNTS